MKLVFVIGLLALCSGTSQAMSLGDAMRAFMAETRILFVGMIGNWNANALADTEACQTVHDLVDAFPPAWALIATDPAYATLRNTLTGANVIVEWDQFIQNDLKKAFGDIMSLRNHPCGGIRGGNAQLVQDIRDTFTNRRSHLLAEIDRLKAASPDFAALMGRIAAEQATVTTIRCSPQFEPVGQIYRRAGFDVDEVASIIGAVFGWTTITPC